MSPKLEVGVKEYAIPHPVQEDTVKADTLRLVMVEDALFTDKLPVRFKVVPVAVRFCAVRFDAFRLTMVEDAALARKLPVIAKDVVVALVAENKDALSRLPTERLPEVVMNPVLAMPLRVEEALTVRLPETVPPDKGR